MTFSALASESEGPPTIIQGYVYIDGIITQTEEVKIIFPDQVKSTTPTTDGRYVFVFSDDKPGDYGTFEVIFNKKNTYIPSETLTIQEGVFLYNINLNINTTDDEISPDDDDNGQIPTDGNLPPIADAGGPYYEVINKTLTFDGSTSTDPDGKISTYSWDLGDGTNKTGKTVTHNYTDEGKYQIILTVTDNNDTTDEDITYATITKDTNNPPTQPFLIGNKTGSVNILYNFTVTSTDPNNNIIQYVIDWGDQTNTISEFFQNGTSYTTNHQWTKPGIYIIKTYAEDNKSTISKTTKMKVLIDTFFCQNYGFLIDYTNDNIFDVFHSNYTGNETFTKYVEGNYLINDDDDEAWDFEYNIKTDTVFNFGDAGIFQEKNLQENTTILFILGIIVIIIFTIFSILIISRKKQKTNKKEKIKDKKEKTSNPKKQQEKTVKDEKNDIKDIEKEVDKILKNK